MQWSPFAPQNRRRTVDLIAGTLEWVSGAAVLLTTAVNKWPSGRPAGVLQSTVDGWQAWSVVILVAATLVILLSKLARQHLGRDLERAIVQTLIDEFREDIFGGRMGEPMDYHRVTLFQYKWLGSRLKPIARSNHLAKSNIPSFAASDKADSCEGVVGYAWRCNGREWLQVPEPNRSLPVLNPASAPNQIQRYADATKVKPAWVKSRLAAGKALAACYAAAPVWVRGRPWGVIIIDSRSPNAISREKLDRFPLYLKLLLPVLERL